MCELYAVSSQEPVVLNDTLKLFYQHSVRHPHGWGLAHWESAQAIIYREQRSALDSEFLKRLLEQPIFSKVALAHIRFATVGAIGFENCHPFTRIDSYGREWTLIHNGTIFSGIHLIPYEEKQKGRTDSERVLLYLLDCMEQVAQEKGAPLNVRERSKVMEQVVKDLSPRNKLNLLLYDSEQLYVHTNMKDTLFHAQQGETCFFVTAPLENDFAWKCLPLNTLQTYQNGALTYTGTPHPHEFISAGSIGFQDIGDFQI